MFCKFTLYLLIETSFISNEFSVAAFEYLKSNIDTYEEQKDKWLLCRAKRINFLKNHSIYEYLNLIPALKSQFGCQLLLLDFNVSYPTQQKTLYSVWQHLSIAVLRTAVEKQFFKEDVLREVNGL